MSLSDISSKFTEATLDSIIQKAGGTRHSSFIFGEGFRKGDSYLSTVFRLCVYGINEKNGTPIEVNLIIKTMPKDPERCKVFRCIAFFRNEYNYYINIIPAFNKFETNLHPKKPFIEYPICYAALNDDKNDFIALEDLSFNGYTAPKRQDYVTLEECMLTIRTIGRFHGWSFAFRYKSSHEFDAACNTLKEVYYNEYVRDWYMDFLRTACIVARDAVSKTYPNSKYEALCNKYLQEELLYNDQMRLADVRTTYSVISHGDCWAPNFLTRYSSDGQPEAMKMIDFQLARICSFALDLTFFIYTCTSQEMREQHYDTLLKLYHKTVCDTMKDYEVDPACCFSWENMIGELKMFGRFGCGMAIESIPLSMLEDDEVADLDNIKKDAVLSDVWKLTPLKDPVKRKRLADIFKHAIDQGYIKEPLFPFKDFL